MRTAPPIASQIVALVLGAVLLAAIALFAVTFAGPPPRAAPVALSDVRALLIRGVPLPPNVQPVQMVVQDGPPVAPRGLTRVPEAEAALDLGVVRVWAPPGGAGMAGRELRGRYLAAMRLPEGRWRVARARAAPWLTAWHRTTLLAVAGLLVLMCGVAWAIARAITGPLNRLSDAVAATKHGRTPADLPVGGPPEVRRLAGAINALTDRVAATLESRTESLAAITHDLATPLSRLAFRVEALPDPVRGRAHDDIAEMRALIASVLDFARGEMAPAEPVALRPLLERVRADAVEAGRDARLQLPDTVGEARVLGSPEGLRRLLDNLVSNALRYGSRVELALALAGSRAVVTVTDDGPGLPPGLGDRVFDPFVRGEASRNRATGGAGLGLAIARSIARGLGGDLTGADGPDGGARLTVTLPLVG